MFLKLLQRDSRPLTSLSGCGTGAPPRRGRRRSELLRSSPMRIAKGSIVHHRQAQNMYHLSAVKEEQAQKKGSNFELQLVQYIPIEARWYWKLKLFFKSLEKRTNGREGAQRSHTRIPQSLPRMESGTMKYAELMACIYSVPFERRGVLCRWDHPFEDGYMKSNKLHGSLNRKLGVLGKTKNETRLDGMRSKCIENKDENCASNKAGSALGKWATARNADGCWIFGKSRGTGRDYLDPR